jgi:DMSO/TMAO reductase YedYZ molybdopterin-dependent catalytic subunit
MLLSSGRVYWFGILSKSGIDSRASTVNFIAHDGYTTSFPPDYLVNRDIIVAYNMNSVTLPASREFPFELVVEDKWDTNRLNG